MTIQEVLQLRNGDEVYWNDPANGECSKYITIQDITVQGVNEPYFDKTLPDWVVSIIGKDGSELECFAHELT